MNQYESNYRYLAELLQGRDHLRIQNDPYMPLVVEKIEGTPFISLCHYGEQNHDPMRDPEVVFLTSETIEDEGESTRMVREAKPVYFRNDYVAFEEATVEEDFGDVPVKPQRQKSLDSFVGDWWTNIKEQGFFEKAKEVAAKQAAEQEQQADAGREVDGGPEMEP